MEGGTRAVRGETKRGQKKEIKNKRKKQSCPIFFTVFQLSESGTPRIKVGLLDESYE